MGFHRIALRIAAMEALAPSAAYASGVGFATLAGPLIFDSRQDPIDHLDKIEAKPLAMIFTEQDHGQSYGTGETDPDMRSVALVFELQMASQGTIEMQDQNGETETLGTMSVPVSDAEHEARLDALEGQIEYALRWSPLGYFFRRFATVKRIESVPYRTANEKTRLAARTVTWTIDPITLSFPDPTFAASPTGLDALSKPLSDLAKSLPAGSRNRVLLEGLVSQAPLSPPLVKNQGFPATFSLNGVRLDAPS